MQQATEPQKFFASLVHRVTRKRLAGTVVLPVIWLLLFYALILHVRLALGRWPHFGEHLNGWLGLHERAVWLSILPLYFSVYAAAFVFISCLFFRRLRHFSIYALCYAAVLLLGALAALFLRPVPF